MKRLLVICPYPEHKAPSQRLKYEQYFSYFRANGYQVDVRPFMSEALWSIAYKPGKTLQKLWHLLAGYARRFGLLWSLRGYDVVYVHLWVTPIGPPVFEKLVLSLARNVVYDIDDLVYLKNEKADKWYTRIFKGRKKPIVLMRSADHVITCTPYLDSFVRRYNEATTDISSTINTSAYQPVNPYSNDLKITLGWSGSFSTARYLKLLEPMLRKLGESIDFRLLVMGDSNLSMNGVEVEAIEWSEASEVGFLQQFDIGLYPLPLDEEWVYGKSGLKALQYMALGLPTVATAIGTNFRIIESGTNGMLVTTDDEWLQALTLLAGNPDERRRIGANARRTVVEEYSIEANKDRYLDILDALTGRSKTRA